MKTYERLELIVMFLDWYAQMPDKNDSPATNIFQEAQKHFEKLQDELVNMEKFIDE